MKEININDFINYEIKVKIASVFSKKENKSLTFIHNTTSGVQYLVNNIKANKADYFFDLKDAIDFYNKY